jgi:hypothetical protein
MMFTFTILQVLHNGTGLLVVRCVLERSLYSHAAIADCKLFVGHVPVGWGEDELRDLFSAYGDVQEVMLKRNPDGTSKGFGFVTCRHSHAIDMLVYRLYMRWCDLYVGCSGFHYSC